MQTCFKTPGINNNTIKYFQMKNKFIYGVGLLLLIASVQFGCQKGPNFKEYTYPAQSSSGLNPGIGFPGQNVTITGTNFDTLKGAVKVWFGGILATKVVSNNGTQIVVQIPANAVSGKVGLQVWTTKTDSIGSFTVLPMPVVSSVISHGLAPVIAQPGDTVYISGQNFIQDPSKVAIDFNGTAAPNITLLTSSLIKVIAPAGYTGGNVNITFNGNYTLTGSALSPVLPTGDVSIYFLKNYKQPFTANNMASNQGFNGSNWGTPDFWTINSAAQNQINGGATVRCGGANYGKPGMANVGQLCLQAGFSDAIGNVVTNGKMYQTTTLPAGNYQVDIQVKESGFSNYPTLSNMYLVVANGSTIPDLISANTAPTPALATVGIQNNKSYNNPDVVQSVTFTLTQSTQVSIGFVATMVANSYVRLNYLKLTLL
jgi:hypothetical protein